MLVLTRKPNQQLHIGNDIVITIVKVRGNTIRLGIEAPKDVRVIRSELEPKDLSPKGEKTVGLDVVGFEAATSDAVTLDSDSAANASAAEDDQPSAADAAEGEITATRMLVQAAPQARSQESRVRGAAPLKRFTTARLSLGGLPEQNLEDCPLCHRAGHDSAPAERTGGLHNYVALKQRTAARDQQSACKKPQSAHSLTAQD